MEIEIRERGTLKDLAFTSILFIREYSVDDYMAIAEALYARLLGWED